MSRHVGVNKIRGVQTAASHSYTIRIHTNIALVSTMQRDIKVLSMCLTDIGAHAVLQVRQPRAAAHIWEQTNSYSRHKVRKIITISLKHRYMHLSQAWRTRPSRWRCGTPRRWRPRRLRPSRSRPISTLGVPMTQQACSS